MTVLAILFLLFAFAAGWGSHVAYSAARKRRNRDVVKAKADEIDENVANLSSRARSELLHGRDSD